MTVKTPIKATFTGSDVTGLAEFQSADFIGVIDGGTGAVTLTSNSILLGNGTDAIQSSPIQISGSTISVSDSTTITIDEGLSVTGTITSGNLLPPTDNTGAVGTNDLTWNDGRFTNFTIDNILNVRTAIDLADGDILRFGTNDDWELFHDGTANRIDLNVGDLTIRDGITTRFTFGRTTGDFTATGNIALQSSITFEGSTADDFETTLGVIDPTADRAINLPNVSGTVLTTGNITDLETPIGNLTEISSVANDDVFLAIDTSGGGIKKITRSTIVSGLAGLSAISNIVEDTTPQLGGNLDVNGNSIVSVSDGNISIVPNGSGKVILDGDGSVSGVSITDGLIDIRSSTGQVSKIKFYCEVSNAHFQTLQASPHAAASSAVLTLPELTGNLIGTGDSGTVTNTMLTNSSFTLADDSSTTTTISLGESLIVSGTANEIETAISGDTLTIGLPSNVTIGNNLTVTGDLTVNGTTTTVNSTTIEITNSFTFEGSTADEFETTLGVIDPTADRAINLPNVSGTVITSGNLSDITSVGTLSSLTVGASGITFNDGSTQTSAGASNAFAIAQAVALG